MQPASQVPAAEHPPAQQADRDSWGRGTHAIVRANVPDFPERPRVTTTTRKVFRHGIESLEAAIRRAGSPVELLRQSTARPHAFPVAPEFTNWRTEQNAWRSSCVLFDQSHHMTDLFLRGPGRAGAAQPLRRQLVRQLRSGQGQAVRRGQRRRPLHRRRHPASTSTTSCSTSWATRRSPTGCSTTRRPGDYDVTVERDDNSVDRAVRAAAALYRYELQGPAAGPIVAKLTGAPLPDVKFFHMTEFTIAGHRVRALRHGMAGQPGFELFGPWAEGDDVLAAILARGRGVRPRAGPAPRPTPRRTSSRAGSRRRCRRSSARR